MGEILSQDEVNALLQAVDDGGLPEGGTASGEGRSAVRALDLANLQWSVEARFPGLKPIVDRFGRALRTSLATFLGQLPNVSPRPAQMVKYGTIVESLVAPVSLQIFRMAPLPGHGMLVATPSLVAALLQAFFGGDPGHKTPVQSHEFSAIELGALERLGGKVLHDLREAWSPLETLDCAVVRSETVPRFAAIAGPQDLVLVIDVAVECQGCEDGRLTVYIPNAALEPVRSRLHRPDQHLTHQGDETGRNGEHYDRGATGPGLLSKVRDIMPLSGKQVAMGFQGKQQAGDIHGE